MWNKLIYLNLLLTFEGQSNGLLTDLESPTGYDIMLASGKLTDSVSAITFASYDPRL